MWSAPAYREITANADFHGATHSGQVAADVDFDNSAPITGVEDRGVNWQPAQADGDPGHGGQRGMTSSASSSLVSPGVNVQGSPSTSSAASTLKVAGRPR